tara:strand:- start:682 stop:1017 length:336 start_codon:yes stop_codon:yes gene_type:complete
MKDLSTKILAVIASLMTTAIIGGFSFIKQVESRLAVIEDDLGETVEIVGMLHPPQRSSVHITPEVYYADNKKKKRKKILDRLKKQIEEEEKKDKKKEEKKDDNSQVNVTFY